jgi:hypothetical protein
MVVQLRIDPRSPLRLIGPIMQFDRLGIQAKALTHYPAPVSVFIPHHGPFRIPIPDIGYDFIWCLGIASPLICAYLMIQVKPGRFIMPAKFTAACFIKTIAIGCTVPADWPAPPGTTDSPMNVFMDTVFPRMARVRTTDQVLEMIRQRAK